MGPTTPEGEHNAGMTPGEGLRTTLEGAPPRLTAEDVERARAEQKQAFGKLMDDMETSVDSQGKWFVKLGDKRTLTETREVPARSGILGVGRREATQKEIPVGQSDERALILKAPLEYNFHGSERIDFLVVTEDGVHVVPTYKSELTNPQGDVAQDRKANYELVKALTDGTKTPDDTARYRPAGKGGFRPVIESERGFDVTREPGGWTRSIGLERVDPAFVSEHFQRVVQESIQRTESPHKENVDRARAGTQAATSASNVIQNLPPR